MIEQLLHHALDYDAKTHQKELTIVI